MESDDLEEPPEWLMNLVAGKWTAADWREWHNLCVPALRQRGVTPEMLNPIGDRKKPIAVNADRPGETWIPGGKVDWDSDRPIQDALTGLIANLDAESAAQAGGSD